MSSRNDGELHGLAECTYGTNEVYARVSTHADWIRKTMGEKSDHGSIVAAKNGNWPKTPAGEAATRFFSAFNAGAQDKLLAYAEASLTDDARRKQSPADWANLWHRQYGQYGKLAPTHFVDLNPNKLVVVAAADDRYRAFRFELEGEAPHGLRELSVRRIETLGGLPLQGADRKNAPEPAATPLTEDEQKRYDRVARALVESINAGDRERYRALFTDEGWSSAIDWWHDMFAVQRKNYGEIVRAYAPRRGPVRVGRMGVGGEAGTATFLVQFAEPAGGALSFELNDEDRIVRTDVFVTKELGYSEPEDVRRIFP